ncbi:MAG TPA: DUF433 domain-containing protein [Blastocatellia bacterium]|nr:DUF433 domain-containing protein [Blastocatellia bacterium]
MKKRNHLCLMRSAGCHRIKLYSEVKAIEKSYVTKIEDGHRLTGSRVSLDSIVYDWWNGLSPESIVENFPTLTLEQVYGAIAYYLANKEEVDAQIQRNREKFEELREQWRAAHPRLYEKLKAAAEAETTA